MDIDGRHYVRCSENGCYRSATDYCAICRDPFCPDHVTDAGNGECICFRCEQRAARFKQIATLAAAKR